MARREDFRPLELTEHEQILVVGILIRHQSLGFGERKHLPPNGAESLHRDMLPKGFADDIANGIVLVSPAPLDIVT